ncbi:MAG: hypothetical protein HWD59_03760 [Coxiellaceae bacterium]|nr:MAG: hypothetical protein HWD59_03760 [Coxiellaceae bacterium]
MTGLILNLHLAWKEKQTVNLNPSLGQAIWQYVINYIEQEFVLRGFVGDQDPLLQQPTQWQDITVGELLTSIIAADVDPDQLLPAYQASALENAMTQNQVAWALALMNIGAGRHRRFQSEILLNYINQYQHESILTESIKQAKTRLAKHHPYIAWTLSKASLFQSTELKIPGFPNIKGRLIGMDSGEVFLTEKVFNQLFEIKTTVFGKYEVWRKINTEGKHNIARAIVNGQEFYFKSKPESPWREDAVLCLAEQVFRGAVAYSELFMYIDSQGNATPVLVVQGVQGFTAKTMLKALSFDPKEQAEVENQMTPQQANVALKKLILTALQHYFLIALTGNEDNNPGNLMFELNEGSLNYLLQLIDCDHSF